MGLRICVLVDCGELILKVFVLEGLLEINDFLLFEMVNYFIKRNYFFIEGVVVKKL